jgi:hypothetical protein
MKHIILQHAIPAYLATGSDGKRTHQGLVAIGHGEQKPGVENGCARLAGP